ncbi:MAG: hypothetical protein RIM23_05225, partial [Coleofasciculus sp. G3-WIS-01]|uniref:hypothetical protein n=1 Tax=Coleofasciculus sp. G3-WIS-01 TaxID=3069528 RepID=UPI0032F4AE5F
ISLAKGKTSSAAYCRKIQIKQLESRVKSAKDWVAFAISYRLHSYSLPDFLPINTTISIRR